MDTALAFASSHPMWSWLAIAALLLVMEVGSASGYLLWPAGSAAVVALLTLVWPVGEVGQMVVFSLLTIVTTFIGRRYLRPAAAQLGPDLNDKAARLVGRTGHVTHGFEHGRGRVFVDGAEWSADLAADTTPPAKGAPIEVLDVNSGRLTVRAG